MADNRKRTGGRSSTPREKGACSARRPKAKSQAQHRDGSSSRRDDRRTRRGRQDERDRTWGDDRARNDSCDGARARAGVRGGSDIRGRDASRSGNRDLNQSQKGDYLEGRRATAEALRTGFPIKRALVADGAGRDQALSKLVDDVRDHGIAVSYVSTEELDTLSSHGAHQGIILEVGAFPYADLADIVARVGEGPALVVVLDHVTDDGNFGAIVRSAEIVGAAGVVIANKRAAGVTVGSYKTSAGAVMHMPIAKVPNIARALDDLKQAGFWVAGASEHASDVCWDAPFAGNLALVMGSEGEGISRLVLEKCDFLTKLPQLGQTESLNVAQAACALCFEWMRQNRAGLF